MVWDFVIYICLFINLSIYLWTLTWWEPDSIRLQWIHMEVGIVWGSSVLYVYLSINLYIYLWTIPGWEPDSIRFQWIHMEVGIVGGSSHWFKYSKLLKNLKENVIWSWINYTNLRYWLYIVQINTIYFFSH